MPTPDYLFRSLSALKKILAPTEPRNAMKRFFMIVSGFFVALWEGAAADIRRMEGHILSVFMTSRIATFQLAPL
ncbi:hypothetical protein [Xanthomonas graminis]|uniref:hypothetical protein n=1 Tax=Xanthomonas graminis TaxID=3390026 RepID=UPI001F16F815|nr:hypothetical protein [Xanthomonas translucens]UKE73146.1 hypothetical protein KFS85_19375 [Xanthomonas translucens pv. phleipratensis]